MQTWMRWIGLPHEFRAHPNEGKGCDCLLMTWAVLDEADVPHPPLDPSWLDLAEAGEWDHLQSLWKANTITVDKPEPYAVCLFKNGPSGLGLGVVVDNGVLMVHHRRGVCWVPLTTVRRLSFCKLI